ncbi:hypothetical protein AVEN_85356-1 [Araneus ventricosus]|uniref:Uncharacterized protein n=1 Tax=Araneus ventricosus TaxID=182803 RepID=A0A4Y2DZS5_ARAVE|nr:hypothetical protein AVEN_85356-1 [Araneus ventricosus]
MTSPIQLLCTFPSNWTGNWTSLSTWQPTEQYTLTIILAVTVGNKIVQLWRYIRDTYARSLRGKNLDRLVKAQTKYIAQLSVLETAGARTETQPSLEETVIEEDSEQQNGLQQKKQKQLSEKSPSM